MISTETKDGAFVVVTPNYNMGRYLAATIESVLENLRPGDEYFIIDGGSTDNSIDVIKQYEHRISGWLSEKDRGYADALSKGFAKGTVEYQCWINSGDLLLKGALDLARACLRKSGADMIFGDDFYIDDNDRVLGYSRGMCRNLYGAMVYGGWTPLQDACFWRRALYEQVGGMDVNLRNAADYALFARFSAQGQTRYVPYAFSTFRRHDGQRSVLHSAAYQSERSIVRRRLAAMSTDGKISKWIKQAYYFVAVRWRARVLHRLWDLPRLHGRLVDELAAGSYWPAASNGAIDPDRIK